MGEKERFHFGHVKVEVQKHTWNDNITFNKGMTELEFFSVTQNTMTTRSGGTQREPHLDKYRSFLSLLILLSPQCPLEGIQFKYTTDKYDGALWLHSLPTMANLRAAGCFPPNHGENTRCVLLPCHTLRLTYSPLAF